MQTHPMQNPPPSAPRTLGAAGGPSPPHHLGCFTGQGDKVHPPSAQAALPGAAGRHTLRALGGGGGARSEVSGEPGGTRPRERAAIRPGLSQLGPQRPLGRVVPAAKGGLHFPATPPRSLAAGRGKAAGCPGSGPVPWRGGPGREAAGERGCGGGRGIAAAGWEAWSTARYRERDEGGGRGVPRGLLLCPSPARPAALLRVALEGFPPK